MEVGDRRAELGQRVGNGEWAVDGVEGLALKSEGTSLTQGMTFKKIVLSYF